MKECFVLEVTDQLLSMIIFSTQLLFLFEDIFDNGYNAKLFFCLATVIWELEYSFRMLLTKFTVLEMNFVNFLIIKYNIKY